MKILKRGLLIKFLKIFALIIFIFPNSIDFGAISYVDDINVPASSATIDITAEKND